MVAVAAATFLAGYTSSTTAARRLLPTALRRARRQWCTAPHRLPINRETDEIVDAAERRILSMFERHGSGNYIGEPCSITEHSVQAASAAAKAGEDDTAILACLLHDIGHLAGLEAGLEPGMDGCGTPKHERVGAELLGALGLPEDVCFLTHKHVSAKRYLCATVPDYYDRLTDASKTTLKHQGGPMTADEVRRAEADPRWPVVLRMRSYDEAGKDAEAAFAHPSELVTTLLRPALRASVRRQLEARAAGDGGSTARLYYPLSPHARSYVLSEEQLRCWDEHGWLLVRDALPPAFDAATLSAMADEAAALPRGGGGGGGGASSVTPWLVHHERSQLDGEVRICRVENFCNHLPRWSDVAFGAVQALVSQCFREPAVLFKDKINYKGPGGGSFLAHQDATAYATDDLATRHISVGVAIDTADAHNGPLELPARAGLHTQGILPHAHGVIDAGVEDAAGPWTPVLVSPGDVVLFDSYLPHRSHANTSSRWRRSAYLTYNRAREGDFHGAYYSKKRAAFDDGSAGAISINRDFGGNIVQEPP